MLALVGTTIYASMQRARLWNVKRYRRFVIFLACHELNKEPDGTHHRTQEAVCKRAEQIHRRHFPKNANVSFKPRTLRNDDLCLRLCHRLRDYKTARKASCDKQGQRLDRLVSRHDHGVEIERRERAEGLVRELRGELAVVNALLQMAERQGYKIDPRKVQQD